MGRLFLAHYADGLLTANAEKMAALFHPGLTYIVNDLQRPACETFCTKELWETIFSKVEFLAAEAHHVLEPHPGHIFYHEMVRVRVRATGEVREGHFGDEAVVNKDVKMLLVNRIADPLYYEWLGTAFV